MGLVPFLQMMLTHVCSNKLMLPSPLTHLAGMTSMHADWNTEEEKAQQQGEEEGRDIAQLIKASPYHRIIPKLPALCLTGPSSSPSTFAIPPHILWANYIKFLRALIIFYAISYIWAFLCPIVSTGKVLTPLPHSEPLSFQQDINQNSYLPTRI